MEISVIAKDQFEQLCSEISELKNLLRGIKEPSRDDPNELISVKQLRELLGISAKTEWTWRKKPVIPYVRYGKKIYFRKADVETFVRENGIGSEK